MKTKIKYLLVVLGLLPIKNHLQMFFLTFICCFLVLVPFIIMATLCRVLIYLWSLEPTNLYYDLLTRYAFCGIHGGLIFSVFPFLLISFAILFDWFTKKKL
jgi:hypothetical protein